MSTQTFFVCQGVCQQARVQADPQNSIMLDLVLAAPSLEGCLDNLFLAGKIEGKVECCLGSRLQDRVSGLVASRVVRLPHTLVLNIKRAAVSHQSQPLTHSATMCH